ncbi:MAG: O-antigen ligase family protein [Patescibacteria group bacterium]|nr:O-antigen ligase family protein [Patescibacteria group bacterium]MDD5490747.1 O-antigen ligase family protein [Patescibacteria group bacterium]
MPDIFTKNKLRNFSIAAVFLILAAILSFVIPPVLLLFAIAGILAVIFFSFYPEVGLYSMVLIYPFIYWQFYFKTPPQIFTDLLEDINVPYIDILAMTVFAGWFLRILYLHFSGQEKMSWKIFPGLGLFVAFIAVSSLSLFNAENFLAGAKFILRPLTFFYLMFVVLPFNVIKNKKILLNVFRCFFLVGIFVAGMGLWSLIFTDRPGWLNPAIPVAVFGVHILGTNHNLIGEVLISIIPLLFILMENESREILRRIYFLSLIFLVVITLLSLSRTAWICLFIELALMVLIHYRPRVKDLAFPVLILLLIFSPILIFMGMYITSYTVELSNYNRILMTDISVDIFSKHPWIGNGVGSFRDQLASYYIYLVEFGEPSEAHGVLQKLLPEVGILGTATFFALWGFVLYKLIWVFRKIKSSPAWRFVVLNCMMAAAGSMVFQLFNTSYFVSKLWLPLGVALAAANLALHYAGEEELSK